eukprot:TRINITY_DN29215_c0_g1_i1.p1 TRINITY_DN29215_c0_g1~~TRINITY_DN29215_c0_g1_i1.p1  ORF type:complete len:100 (-),score=0.24 TRINITY_DN29215_c0_g1_i1:95-394(-)
MCIRDSSRSLFLPATTAGSFSLATSMLKSSSPALSSPLDRTLRAESSFDPLLIALGPPRLDTNLPSTVTAAPRLLGCLLYTSDAADEEDSVDVRGRRHY